MNRPDFYLSSSEGYGMEEPRAGTIVKRLRGEGREDYLLIQIDPPLIGQYFGLGERDLDQVIIGTRHREESLFPIAYWPLNVYVARLVVPYEGKDVVRSDEIELIAWAEIYPTEKAARAKGT